MLKRSGMKAVLFHFPEVIMKALIQRALRRFGLTISRTQPTLIDFIKQRQVDLVLDVGANEGQFATMLRAKGYRGKIMSFEPVSAVFEILAAKASNDADWDVHNFALGASTQQSTINVSDLSVFSSLLSLNENATKFHHGAAVSRVERIEVRSLDDVLPTVSGHVLLKIDTQGYERQVLEGARQSLRSLTGVLMELPFMQLYEGNWDLRDALAFMDSAGFIPAQIHPVNFHPRDKVSMVEVDCLFRPRTRELDGEGMAHLSAAGTASPIMSQSAI